MADKINIEVAQGELEKWLEFKKITSGKRDENQDDENTLVDNISAGYLVINDDMSLTYNLKIPIENDDGEVTVDKLTFRPRIRYRDLNKYLRGVKPQDVEGRQTAYIAAITTQNKGIIGSLWSEDLDVCTSIMNYFL